MGLLDKKSEDSEKDVSLDAPKSLPDSLIDTYGLANQESSSVASKEAHPRQLPKDLADKKIFVDKLDNSSSVEFFKEHSSENKDSDTSNNDAIKQSHQESPIQNSPSQDNNVGEEVSSKKLPSFFEVLEKKLGESDSDKHISSDLVDMMKRYHSARSRGEHFFFHEQDLEDVLYKKMLKLKEIEEEWLIRAREFNAAKELLVEKEDEIGRVSEELKALIRKADRFKLFNKNVSHDKAFVLADGKLLLCLNDLVHELRGMSDDVFKKHVFEGKNDFAEWVLHVFGEEKLARKIRSVYSREELLNLLENY